MSNESSHSKIKRLERENQELSEQLLLCKKWIRKEITQKTYHINLERMRGLTRTKMVIGENADVVEMVQGFFDAYRHLPGVPACIEHLIESESNFFHLMKKKNFDGFIVTNGYQKAFEVLVEEMITKDFRSYAKRIKSNLRVNNLTEKTLHKVVTKKYHLSIGKLFETLKSVQHDTRKGPYQKAFLEYLKFLWPFGKFLTSDDFSASWSDLMDSDIFWGRRHIGSISKEETQKIRMNLTGNYNDGQCLFIDFLSHYPDV